MAAVDILINNAGLALGVSSAIEKLVSSVVNQMFLHQVIL